MEEAAGHYRGMGERGGGGGKRRTRYRAPKYRTRHWTSSASHRAIRKERRFPDASDAFRTSVKIYKRVSLVGESNFADNATAAATATVTAAM